MSDVDHLVIAVRDMQGAVSEFRALGFDVMDGGRHEWSGTCNSIITLPCGYLELLAVEDADLARSSSRRGAVLVDYLRTVGGGYLGVAVAADIDTVVSDLSALPSHPPARVEMTRRRSDGRVISWELAIPNAVAWRRPWPFYIQWPGSPPNRRATEQPNGVDSVTRLTMRARDVEAARTLFEASGLPTWSSTAGFHSRLARGRCSTAVDMINAGPGGSPDLPPRFREGIVEAELGVVPDGGIAVLTERLRQAEFRCRSGDASVEVRLESLAGQTLRFRERHDSTDRLG